jgi:hypothetical protein
MTWTWLSPEEREKRNQHVLELWQMGYSRQEIAGRVDVTPQRVSQIVLSFGVEDRNKEVMQPTDRDRPSPTS